MSLLDSLAPNGSAPTAPASGGGLLAAIPSQLKGPAPAASGSMFDTLVPNAFGSVSQSTPAVLPQGQGSFTDLLKGIVQAVPRDVATFGVSLGQADANLYSSIAKVLNLPGQDLGTKSVGIQIPTDSLSWLIGDKPITGFADQAAATINKINASPFAQKTGLSQFSIPLAIAATVVPPSLDFAGFGGEKSALEALARSSSEAEIMGIGQRIGVAQDLLPQFAKSLVDVTDKNAVKDIVDNFSHLQATTKFTDTIATREADAQAAGAKPFSHTPSINPEDVSHVTSQLQGAPEDIREALVPHYQAAPEAKSFVDHLTTHVADEFGGTPHLAPIKGVARVAEKVATDYGGDASKVRDFVRSTITVPDTESAGKALARVRQLDHPVGDPKINIDTPIPSGYRTIIQNVRAPNGMVGEVQITLPELLAAKKNGGDDIYNQMRSLEAKYVGIEPPANVKAKIAALNGEMRQLYGDAYDAAVKRLNSESESTRLSSAPKAAAQPVAGDTHLPPENLRQVSPEKSNISPEPAKTNLGNEDKSLGDASINKSIPDTVAAGKAVEKKEAEAGIKPGAKDTPATIEKKVVAQTFREDKLSLTPEEAEGLNQRLAALGLDTRTVRTFGEMRNAAEALGTDIKGLLKDTKSNRITDAEVVGLRDLINHNSQLMVDLEKQLIDKPGDIELERKMRIADAQVNDALKKLVKGGTEAGRAVAAFRIAANRDMTPATWFARAQRVLDLAPLTNEHKAAILDLISKSDRQGLAEYVSMLRSPSFAEKATTLWKAGLLTSFTTHLANLGGNVTMGLLSEASNVAATTLDVLVGTMTGVRTTTTGLAPILARARGAVAGVKDAAHYLKTGTYTEELLTKYDLPKGPVFKNKILNGYTNAVFRSLGAEDIIFRQSALSASMERQAIVAAKNEGLVGDAAKARIGYLLQNPTNGMVMEAINVSEYETFNNENVLANFISRGKAAVRGQGVAGQVLYTAAEVIAPFTRTPTNVAARIADYSPAGFIKAMVRFANPATRSQKNLVDDLGRAITGSGVMAFGAYLYNKGIMTGNAPTNPGELATFNAQGKQANSIYLGGRWWNMNRLSPFGNLLGLGAEFETLAQDQSGLPLAFSTSVAGIQQLTQQTFLQGVSGALQAVNDPTQSAQTYFNSTASSVIPSIVGRVASTIDPTKRVPDGVLQSIQAKLPFLSESLPAKRDVFGNVVEVTGGRYNLIDPFASTKGVDDPVLDEASRLGISINQPSKTVANGKYTNKEYSAVQLIRGKILHDSLAALNSSDEYNKATNAGKAKIFQTTIDDVNQAVNDQVYPALMIQRYGLPANTNPDLLKSLLTTLNAEPSFKQGSVDWQARVLEKLLTAAQP